MYDNMIEFAVLNDDEQKLGKLIMNGKLLKVSVMYTIK